MFHYSPQDNLSALASAAARKAMSRPASHPVIHLDEMMPFVSRRAKRVETTEAPALKPVEARATTTETTKPTPIPFPTPASSRVQEIATAWQRAASKIVVVGVGGAGGNAVNRMVDQPTANFDGIRFVVANTDAQALKTVLCDERVEIGPKVTRGLGAGGVAAVGQKAAEESIAAIRAMIGSADLVFLTLGLGGGSGGGAAPVIARVARELGAVVVAVATMPFAFEGHQRAAAAKEALESLRAHADTVVAVDNNALLKIMDRKTTLEFAFSVADQCLQQAVDGMVGIIRHAGYINLDFADARATLSRGGRGYFGTGIARGEASAVKAMEQALGSRLLGDSGLSGAKKVLVYFRGDPEMPAQDIHDAMESLRTHLHPDVETIFGFGPDSEMGDQVEVTVFAVGISGSAGTAGVTVPAPRPTPQPTLATAKIAPVKPEFTPITTAAATATTVEAAARVWREETARRTATPPAPRRAENAQPATARATRVSSRDALPRFLERLEKRNENHGTAQKFEITDDHADHFHHDNLDVPAFLRKRGQRSE